MLDMVKLCIDNRIEVKGILKWDPYIGWYDESDKHEFGYVILCELNRIDNCCIYACGNYEEGTCVYEQDEVA